MGKSSQRSFKFIAKRAVFAYGEEHRQFSYLPGAALTVIQKFPRFGLIPREAGQKPKPKQIDTFVGLLHHPRNVVLPKPLARRDSERCVGDFPTLKREYERDT